MAGERGRPKRERRAGLPELQADLIQSRHRDAHPHGQIVAGDQPHSARAATGQNVAGNVEASRRVDGHAARSTCADQQVSGIGHKDAASAAIGIQAADGGHQRLMCQTNSRSRTDGKCRAANEPLGGR